MTTSTPVTQVDPSAFSWDAEDGIAAGVRRTVAAAADADGRSPLNEAALLALRHTGLVGSTLWVAGPADGGLLGFALADAPAGVAGPVEINLVVAPGARQDGLGGSLAARALEAFPQADVSAWSHGNHPAAAALARDLGFERIRDLWVMRRPLSDPLPAVETSGRFVVRTFEPGRDEAAFLDVNAAAFAHHPEQGDLTREDLELRMAEGWFDPAGFFLAVTPDEGRVLGFHWTKVHPADPAYGEVYVVGVSPEAQGMGLGKVLTLTGLHHLRDRGLGEVILYVESDNEAAVAVYRGLGFSHAPEDTDVMYARRH